MHHSGSFRSEHVLQTNLAVLARFNPTSDVTKSFFSEGMFKRPNPRGFYEVLYFLLNLVDQKRCKEKFFWPLYDKKMEQEFRKAVLEFVAQINKNDANACIPVLTPSMLHSPSGDKIVKFILKLVQYAMRKQLQTNFNISEIMDQPQKINNPITPRILMKVLKKKIQDEMENLYALEREHDTYMSESSERFRILEKNLQDLDIQIKKYQEEFKTSIESPHIPRKLKMRIINGDSNVMEEWSNSLNEEMDIYETKVSDLERLYQKISDFRTFVQNAEEWKKSPPCLDGERLKLNISTCISESLTVPVYNLKGEVSLDGFMNYTKHLSEELRKEIVRKYPKSENDSDSKLVLENLIKDSIKINELEKSLDDKISEVKTMISSNQSKIFPHYEDFNQTVLENIPASPKCDFKTSLNTSNIFLEGGCQVKCNQRSAGVESTHTYCHQGETEAKCGDCNQLVCAIKKKNNNKRKLSIVCSIKQNSCRTSTKTATKIPSLIKNQIKFTKPKKIIYSRSACKVQKRKSINNDAGPKKFPETPDVPFSTPLKKKRRSRVSVSPKLDSIPDFINDITCTYPEQEVKGSLSLENCLSTPIISSDSWRSYMDSIEATSSSDQLKDEILLDFSQSTVEGSDVSFSDHNQSEIIPSDFKQQKEERPNRRASLQAIIDKYREFQKKTTNFIDYK